MNASESDVTVTTSILDRIATTISYYTRLFQHNDAILADVQEANAQASNWTRTPPPCPKHLHVRMFQSLIKTPTHNIGDWMCHECQDELRFAWKEHERTSAKIISNSPTYHSGSVLLAIKQAERANQQAAIQQIAIARLPTFQPLPQAKIPTAPLPARDIRYANTLLDDGDATEHRLPAIKLSKATPTLEIPAIGAEITLLEIMRRPTHERGTGEQVKIPEDAFLL